MLLAARSPRTSSVALAIASLVLLREPPRRRPAWIAFGLGLAGVLAALHPMAELPDVRHLMLAYLALLLVAMALFIPWSPAWHLAFLAVVTGLLVTALASLLAVHLDDRFCSDAVMGAAAAMLVSAAGNAVLRGSRLRAFGSAMQLRRLHLDRRQNLTSWPGSTRSLRSSPGAIR